VTHQAGAYPCRRDLSTPPGKLVHGRVTPSIKFAGTHLYTWVERSTVRVKCPAQEHNSPRLIPIPFVPDMSAL